MSLASWSLGYDTLPVASTSKSVVKGTPASLDPPGYVAAVTGGPSKRVTKSTRTPPTPEALMMLKQKKAWDVAFGPAKSVPMNAFMLYMSGSGVQIFSMMIVGMLLSSPIKGALSVGQAFAPLETPGAPHALIFQKLAFILAQLGCLALGVWKCGSMGLLPTQSSDWLAWREARIPLEYSPLRY